MPGHPTPSALRALRVFSGHPWPGNQNLGAENGKKKRYEVTDTVRIGISESQSNISISYGSLTCYSVGD